MPTPFYEDWGFWQGAVAFGALVLTQCPPIKQWFKRPRLEVEVFDKIWVNEELGRPMIQIHLIITNAGNREIRINKLKITLKRDNEIREIFGKGYYENISDQQAVLLVPFRLAPKEEWRHGVNFLNNFSREEAKRNANWGKAMRDDIRSKHERLPENHPLIEADEAIVLPIANAFDSNFFWQPGEYEVALDIETNLPEADAKKTYRFTLFESESEDLKRHRDQLKFGNGVYYSQPPCSEYVQIDFREG